MVKPSVQSRPRSRVREPLLSRSAQDLAASNMGAFMAWCGRHSGSHFGSYAAFERYCVEHSAEFWSLFLHWSGLLCEGSTEPAIVGDNCETARFFPQLHLNYAENLLRLDFPGGAASTAITGVSSGGRVQRWSRGELRERVVTLSAALSALGLTAGDRVAIVAANTPAAVLGCLAAVAIGCTVSTCAPELGAEALLVRLQQIEPQLLMLQSPAEVSASRNLRIAELVRSLPALRGVLLLDDETPAPEVPRLPMHRVSTLLRQHAGQTVAWPRLPFNHPLFVLFTSGTTGAPKCLVHGAGGTLIEHLKEHQLHCDLRCGDRLFFHTSTGWMMWNWQLSALASGAELLLYDGPVSGPDALWRVVSQERVNLFGTSPAYLQLCERGSWVPGDALDFSALRAVMSTGSILYPRQQDWVWNHVKRLAIQSISGGTDIVGCFVLGNPAVDAYNAECQSRSLGLDVRALRHDASPEQEGVGELICANPFPSRPVGLLHDADGSKFHAAYFAANPGVWTHGDLIEFTPEGSARMHGRSDGVLKIRGIRIGPAEIYRVLADLPEICESMAVEQTAENEPGGSRLVLLLVMNPGAEADEALCSRIRRELSKRASPAHVPAVILTVAELPVTHSGKRSERSARDALNGRAIVNAGALRNPACLQPLHEFAKNGAAAPRPASREACGHSLQEILTGIWEEVLQVSPIASAENYFDLGGDSLKAVRIFAELEQRTGRCVPLPLLFSTPTIAGLAAAIERSVIPAYEALVPMAPAEPGNEGLPPLFIIHGVGGSVMELHPLVARLRAGTAVYALQALGFHEGDAPRESVQEMAAAYLGAIRQVQPAGPYLLAGYSFGGLVAYEMARRLRQVGEGVALLGLLDTTVAEPFWPRAAWVEYFWRRLRSNGRRLAAMPLRGWGRFVVRLGQALVERLGQRHANGALSQSEARRIAALPERIRKLVNAGTTAMQGYAPERCTLPVTVFRSDLGVSNLCDPAIVWRRLAGQVRVCEVPGDHLSMIQLPHVQVLADAFSQCIRGACGSLQPAAPLVAASPAPADQQPPAVASPADGGRSGTLRAA